MSEKKGVSIVIVVILSILFLMLGLLGGYIIYEKTSKCDVETSSNESSVAENSKGDNTISKVTGQDEKKMLEDITKVYEDAFNYINSGNLDISSDLSNVTDLKNYFTDKAFDYISRNNNANNMIFFTGIFGITDQGIRPLQILSYTDDTIIATGQLIENPLGDSDTYPLYIIFKKQENSYKIDLFE